MSPPTQDSLQRPASSRDEFSQRTRKTIAARVGWRCSNPECRAVTTGPVSDPSRASVIGVAAHITAAARGGPRFDSALSERDRKSVSNGIWLCASCAKSIDDDCERYTSSVLRFWRLDAELFADQEKGRPHGSTTTLRFAAIGLDPACAWRTSHRLGKVAMRIGAIPQVGFHALPQQAWAELGFSPLTHSFDPIFDLTLVNDSATTSVLSSIGFEAHSIWSDLKGLSPAYKIDVTDGYVLTVDPIEIRAPQLIQLADPIAIPPGAPVRLKLTLAAFRSNLPGNESLLRLLTIANAAVHGSRLINMGVY